MCVRKGRAGVLSYVSSTVAVASWEAHHAELPFAGAYYRAPRDLSMRDLSFTIKGSTHTVSYIDLTVFIDSMDCTSVIVVVRSICTVVRMGCTT